MSRLKLLLACTVAHVLGAPAGHGMAAPREILGDLVCTVSAGAETATDTEATIRNVICSYRISDSGIEEVYFGKLLLRNRLPRRAALIWVVTGPRGPAAGEAGLLTQSYATAPAWVAQSTDWLVGEKREAIALHPYGLNALEGAPRSSDSGVAALTLELVTTQS